jgi:uncharacterized protein YqeY
MTIYETLTNDIKEAMISKNAIKRDCLRGVVSEIKNQTINAGKELTEDICLKVIQKSVKQHYDSIDQFKAGNRDDLVQKETEELSYLKKYLPDVLDEAQTKVIIENLLQTIEPIKKNMGVIMKQLPKNVDKKLASGILNLVLQ